MIISSQRWPVLYYGIYLTYIPDPLNIDFDDKKNILESRFVKMHRRLMRKGLFLSSAKLEWIHHNTCGGLDKVPFYPSIGWKTIISKSEITYA